LLEIKNRIYDKIGSFMLKIRNLQVKVKKKNILKGVNLYVKKAELVVIFGPNGSGKSTLLKTIMGLGGFRIQEGEIEFKGKKINKLKINQRAKLGIGLMFQKVPKIGVLSLEKLIGNFNKNKEEVDKEVANLKTKKLMKRGVNDGLSGGEIKRSELLQLCLQDNDLYLFDEPDSGVDVENLKLMAKRIKKLIKNKKSALLVTHGGEIMKYIGVNRAYVMMGGKIYCQGVAKEMFESISNYGYEACKNCSKKNG